MNPPLMQLGRKVVVDVTAHKEETCFGQYLRPQITRKDANLTA